MVNMSFIHLSDDNLIDCQGSLKMRCVGLGETGPLERSGLSVASGLIRVLEFGYMPILMHTASRHENSYICQALILSSIYIGRSIA